MSIFTFVSRAACAAAASLALALPLAAGHAAEPRAAAMPPYLARFPNFSPAITPQMPGDVDIALKEKLEKALQFSLVQREFDLYSWQMFFALNWPTNNQGRAAPSLEDIKFGAPHWTLWHSSSSIFRADGAPPTACGKSIAALGLTLTRNLAEPVSRGLPPFRPLANAAVNPRTTRLLGVLSAVGELNAANLGGEINQAFSGPLIDQDGNFVFYEIMIDPNEVSYLCAHKLYNINGQVVFSTAGGKVDMPIGLPNKDWSGSFELKFAWKILVPGRDDFSRFFTQDALVMDQGPDGKPVQRAVKVGLVGLHIGHKSETSPQWIWATFEQVDNLAVDSVAHPKLRPSFNDPGCPICAVNIQPQKVNGAYPRVPTQVSRTIPIPPDKVALNDQVSTALARAKSVWQYYQLIDTQWPTNPKAAPAAWNSGLAQAVTNKPGGDPTPVFLTNITMETYFQNGNQPACNQEENVPSSANCPSPYNSLSPGTAIAAYTPAPPVWTATLNNGTQPVTPGTTTQILATESCMGCHSSAGVWVKYNAQLPRSKQPAGSQSGQLTGDFSWLMSQKANWFGQ